MQTYTSGKNDDFIRHQGRATPVITRDAPIIPQNLPIILLRVSREPSPLFLETKPIILDNNLTLLTEKCSCWAVKTMNTTNKKL